MAFEFPHERLLAYQLAVEVRRRMADLRWRTGDGDLKNQGLRAAASIALNLAEGRARQGKARVNHYRIALGSAAEVSAVLDIAFPDDLELRATVARCGHMISGLVRRG